MIEWNLVKVIFTNSSLIQLLRIQLLQLHGQYQGAGIIVGGISLFAVRDSEDRVLQQCLMKTD